MEEDIVPSRETLKWQEQYQRRSVLHRKNVGEKMVKKKKEKQHEISIFSHHPVAQLRTWTAQQEGGNNIKPRSQEKQGSGTK